MSPEPSTTVHTRPNPTVMDQIELAPNSCKPLQEAQSIASRQICLRLALVSCQVALFNARHDRAGKQPGIEKYASMDISTSQGAGDTIGPWNSEPNGTSSTISSR